MKNIIFVMVCVLGVWALTKCAPSSKAKEPGLSDSEVCVQSVALAFYYHDVTDLSELQSGIWGIISNPELDDYQTLAYLTVFHTVQQIAQNVRKKPEVGTEEFWLAVLNRALVECEYKLNSQRFPDE